MKINELGPLVNFDFLGPKPDDFFIDIAGRSTPLVVRHATGQPEFAIVKNALIPYGIWKASSQRPNPSAPRGLTLQSEDGGFTAGITVS